MPVFSARVRHRFGFLRAGLVIVGLLLTVAPTLHANTRFGFGTIIGVDTTGEHSRKNEPSFTVRFAFRNLKWVHFAPVMTYRIKEKTRHGWRVYLLDGKPSTAAEALQVGRAVCMCNNDMVCHVASAPGPAPRAAEASPGDALYRLELRKAVQMDLAKIGRGEVGEPERRTSDIEVLIACRDGVVTAATAMVPLLRGRTDYPLDPAAWSYSDGNVQGQLRFDLVFTDDSRYQPPAGTDVAIVTAVEAQVGDDGSITGTYRGSSGANQVDDECRGRREAALPMPEAGQIWWQIDEFDGSKCHFAVFPFAGAGFGAGELLHFKGYRLGTVDASTLSLDDGRLQGTAACVDQQHGDRAYRLAVDARVYAGRYLMGTCTITDTEGVERKVALRGGFTAAADLQIRGMNTDAEKAMVRELQEELYPGETK